MKIVDLANEIYLENSAPSDTSIAAISFWIRTNVGKLNTMLYEDFYVDSVTFEILDCDREPPHNTLNLLASAIIKEMYKVYRVELDIRKLIAGLQTDTVLSAQDMDFKVVRINKSELLKTYNTIKSEAQKELTMLTHYYRSYHGAPSQVSGDDTEVGYYTGTNAGYIRGYLGS